MCLACQLMSNMTHRDVGRMPSFPESLHCLRSAGRLHGFVPDWTKLGMPLCCMCCRRDELATPSSFLFQALLACKCRLRVVLDHLRTVALKYVCSQLQRIAPDLQQFVGGQLEPWAKGHKMMSRPLLGSGREWWRKTSGWRPRALAKATTMLGTHAFGIASGAGVSM